MRILSFPGSLLHLFFFLAISTSICAQQQTVVQFSGSKMRAPLSLPKGISTVQICGLEQGISYKVIAVPMAFGQNADFEVAPAPALSKGSGGFAFMRENKNVISFSAPSACVDIQVKTSSTEQGLEVPLFLSIQAETGPEAINWFQKAVGQPDQSLLQVEDGFTAQELIENVLVGGGCFQISNVTYSGQNSQIGTFSNGQSNIGSSNGIVMATGNISIAPGPNNLNGAAFGFGFNTPDPDLGTLTTGSTFDMANIEFDFVPTQSQVSFEFVFASEEYCEYVNTKFNDVFGFFISGPGIVGTKNIAVIPSTNTPVTINNVNHMVNANLYTHNTPASGNNCQNGGIGIPPPTPVPPATGPAVQELQYDGFTKKMIAVANVIPCQKYHIKLKIADVADGVWDSAVFLRANSFNAGGEVLATPAYPGAQGVAYERCSTGKIRFTRSNGNLSQPLVVNFTVAGSATPGVDYEAITSPVIIPAGQSEIQIPITVIPDNVTEGTEDVLFTIPNSCSCTQGTVSFLINDRPGMIIDAADQTLCAGENATLQASVSGIIPNSSYSYLWNTGETTASISPSISGTYSVTVNDGCSVPAQISMELEFRAPTKLNKSISFCSGESVTIGGQVYTQSGIVTETLQGQAGKCDTIVTYQLTQVQQPTRTETIVFCPGESILLGGTVYTEPRVVTLVLPSTNGVCDTMVTYILQFSTPAPSNISINCPAPIIIAEPGDLNGTVVNYNQPSASSDCFCPGIAVKMTSGLASGSSFPAGTTSVCYTAKDSCGQSASCCFKVSIQEDEACDTKVNSCIKYELLSITEDIGKNRTYRIRVTNNCLNKLIYTAIQIPDGLVAMEPANFSTYSAPSGNTYLVRSPNFSPQYSIRYASLADSIHNGESDIFKYTLPAQANVAYIHVVSRLSPYVYLSAHLNTFYCPIGVTPSDNRPDPSSDPRNAPNDFDDPNDQILLFPNPSHGELFADFSAWQGQRLNVQVLDSRGQRVFFQSLLAIDDAQAIDLPQELAGGLYFMEVLTENGGKMMGRFMIQK